MSAISNVIGEEHTSQTGLENSESSAEDSGCNNKGVLDGIQKSISSQTGDQPLKQDAIAPNLISRRISVGNITGLLELISFEDPSAREIGWSKSNDNIRPDCSDIMISERSYSFSECVESRENNEYGICGTCTTKSEGEDAVPKIIDVLDVVLDIAQQDIAHKMSFDGSKLSNNVMDRGFETGNVDKIAVVGQGLEESSSLVVSESRLESAFELAGDRELRKLNCVEGKGIDGIDVKTSSEERFVKDLKVFSIAEIKEAAWRKDCLIPGILDLPMEVLGLIFRRFFSFLEVSAFRLVCQRFANVADYVLRTGLVSLKNIIVDKIQTLNVLLSYHETSDPNKLIVIQRNKLRIFREYNILEILLSEYKVLRAVTWKHFHENSTCFTGGYILDEFHRILRMINEDSVIETFSRVSIDFRVTDMLSCVNSKFINLYERHHLEMTSGRSEDFGVRVLNLLDCCINADSHLIVTHGDRTCHILGHYDLRDCVLPPLPSGFKNVGGGNEVAPEALAAWLQGLRQAIQDQNQRAVHERQKEMDAAAMIHGNVGIPNMPFPTFQLDTWRRRQRTRLTRDDGEERYRHILETRMVDSSRQQRPLASSTITRLVVELQCVNSEAPLDLQEFLPVPVAADGEEDREDSPGQFCMTVTVHAVPPANEPAGYRVQCGSTEGGDGTGMDCRLVLRE